MQNKIELLPSNASILQNTSKLDVSQGGGFSAEDIMNNAHSASPSSSFIHTSKKPNAGVIDTSLIDLQGGNML